MHGWIVLAFGGAANPYADEPTVAYAYDDRVQNHKRLQVGDILFVRNRHRLEGAGRVTRIETGDGEKTFLRCPECGSPRIHFRRSVTPSYRCHAGHTFSDPQEVREAVKTFRAIYEGSYHATTAKIAAAELKPFHLRNTQQMAIMPVELDGISRYLARCDPAMSEALSQWLPQPANSLADDDADEAPDLTPIGFDERSRILRAIRVRRGQYAFRQLLMARFGAKCVISGCTVQGVLEAAHIRPYRGPQDNHPANGLLLRADLHTLFDLNRIAIEPQTLKVIVHPELGGSEYAWFAGKRLLVEDGKHPDAAALDFRWEEYKREANSADSTAAAPSTPVS